MCPGRCSRRRRCGSGRCRPSRRCPGRGRGRPARTGRPSGCRRVEAGRVDLRLDGEVALGQRLAEEGHGPVSAWSSAPAPSGKARLPPSIRGARAPVAGVVGMPEAPALGVERAVERVRLGAGTCRRSRTGRRPPSPRGRGTSRRWRCRRRCSRGTRRGPRAAARCSGAAWPAWPISVQVCAVVARELADHLRAVVAGAQQHLVGQLAARRRRDALTGSADRRRRPG